MLLASGIPVGNESWPWAAVSAWCGGVGAIHTSPDYRMSVATWFVGIASNRVVAVAIFEVGLTEIWCFEGTSVDDLDDIKYHKNCMDHQPLAQQPLCF